MTDSFPMFARCAERQWAGLTRGQQYVVMKAWSDGRRAIIEHSLDIITPVWSVVRPGTGETINLITMKEDAWGLKASVVAAKLRSDG